MSDIQYTNLDYKYSDIKHLYGEKVHILSNPYLQTILQKLSHPDTKQPFLNKYVDVLYKHLIETAVNVCFPREFVNSETRMKEFNEEGIPLPRALAERGRAALVGELDGAERRFVAPYEHGLDVSTVNGGVRLEEESDEQIRGEILHGAQHVNVGGLALGIRV